MPGNEKHRRYSGAKNGGRKRSAAAVYQGV